MNTSDVEFGDRILTGLGKIPDLAAECQRLGIPADAPYTTCPRCNTTLCVSLQAFLEGRVKVCRECTEAADDALDDALIMKQEAYEKAETVLRNVWVLPETLHEVYDLIKPLYDKHDHATTYRDRVGYVLTTIEAALEGTEYAIGKLLPLGEWCICTGNEGKATHEVQFGDPPTMVEIAVQQTRAVTTSRCQFASGLCILTSLAMNSAVSPRTGPSVSSSAGVTKAVGPTPPANPSRSPTSSSLSQ